ncbi:MAG TPA: DNA repair protein RecN [Bacteroidota bacterium]|jgi:DNA repair protein RecN (Recombination protein N)
MLNTLTIKNYALIDDLNVAFEPGLNIITGETGAGKSIVIGALGLVLGERGDADAVRGGAEKAIVEASLSVGGNKGLKELLETHEIEFSGELLLRREISVRGQSRSFMNDTPATTGLLKQAGDLLVDLHGQHEHQSLLRAGTHIGLLDDFGGLEGLAGEFREAYGHAQEILKNLRDLRAKELTLKDRRVLYDFQVREIDAVGPRPGEEGDLESELNILEHAERLFSATERLYQMIYEGDNAVHDQLVLARNELQNLASIDKSLEEPANEAAAAAAIVDELAKFIQRYTSRIEFNPDRLEEIRNRLGQLALLKKKYGGSLETIVEHRGTIGRELELADNFEAEIAALRKQLDRQKNACSEIAQRLSLKRHELAKKLNRSVQAALVALGIPHASFETRIVHRPAPPGDEAIVTLGRECFDATPKGIDEVEFHVSTNAGEEPKPLAKVASGGEISRIMLALKMILAKSDRLPLLVFDEIDVGVSGRIAQAVGRNLKNLSRFHQVIAITHLPQIAGFADTHYVVEKVELDGRSSSRMRKLELGERINEVAKLLSGSEVTQSGLESARELMGLLP